jgi:N-acetylglucosamine-6-sulfatase
MAHAGVAWGRLPPSHAWYACEPRVWVARLRGPLTFHPTPFPPSPRSSDHGYNLGTFRLPAEKYHVYSNDLRVPLIIRGPGIPSGSINAGLVAQTDVGETILDLAGLPPHAGVDGRSFKALALGGGSLPMPAALQDALSGAPSAARSAILMDATPAAPPLPGWRDRMLVEYWGLGYVARGCCSNFTGACPGPCDALVDAPSNTYAALHVRNATHHAVWAEFRPRQAGAAPGATNWTEAYDLATDMWEMDNLWPSGMPNSTQAAWREELWALANCTGTGGPAACM